MFLTSPLGFASEWFHWEVAECPWAALAYLSAALVYPYLAVLAYL